MINPKSALINWLLASRIPSIRYLTYTKLLEMDESENIVRKEFSAIQNEGPVPAILARQISSGQWPYLNHFYTPKYVSTHWSLLLLKELVVDPQTPRFLEGVEYMLSATDADIRERQSLTEPDLVCLWANIAVYAIHGKKLGDERLTRLLEVCAKSIRDTDCVCKHNLDLPCSWGVVRALWAFALIPENQRTPLINEAIQQGIHFLLEKFDLPQANYPSPDNKTHAVWSKTSFPLFYQSDILMTLRVMGELNQLNHPGAQPALDWLEKRRTKAGIWRGSNPFRQRTWPEFADKDETDRWVSLFCAWVLDRAGRDL